MFTIDNISKGFGSQELFTGTGFQINSGERVGLVGRNGHGKTTLLNMISGSDHPDEGSISFPSGYRLGFLEQQIRFTKPKVIEEAILGLPEHEKDHYWKAEKILSGLGFSNTDLNRDPMAFSGGFQVRLNLAKVLVSEPDLLILDEPTNYLDITSIRWISGFLSSWPRELLLVTHDRGFMDSVVTHIAGIHRCKIKKIKGDTSKYYFQVAQDEEVYEKTRVNEEKKRKEVELFITRFRAKARLASMVQSRIKTLEKSQPKDKLQSLKQLDFKFREQPFAGKQNLIVNGLTFSWTRDLPLINNLSLTIYPGDRIGVVGKNGKGKTTLLKLLNQDLDPLSGDVRINPGVLTGYFEQTNIQTLNDAFTIEQELMISSPDTDMQTARNICGSMMFEKDAALKKISVLSGGEKSRVMLGKLLMTPLNLLLLDEPSNHLDMETCDAFVASLIHFSGAVVLVTHNEMFLHALANRLVVFNRDKIEIFEGTYQEFLDKQGWENESLPIQKKEKHSSLTKKQIRKKKSDIITQKSKLIRPIKHEIDGLETKIDENDDLISQINAQLLEASGSQDIQQIQTLSKKLSVLEKENEISFDRLEELTIKFDDIESEYDIKIKAIERIE